MKKIAVLLFASALLLTGCTVREHTQEGFAMDTVVSQAVYAQDSDILIRNYGTVRELENGMSKTLEGSDIYRLNRAGGQSVSFSSQDALHMLEDCLFYAEQTGGAYHPALGRVVDAWGFGNGQRVPSAQELQGLLQQSGYENIRIDGSEVNAGSAWVDLGGAAKGYALDAVKRNLDEAGVENALIAVGGSIYARGEKPDGNWKVGIRDPQGGASDFLATVELEDTCISTSGSYERGFTEDGVYYHHIIDPETGYPVQNGLVSVSVVNENGLLTDIYSTALFVMGLEEGLAHAEKHGIDALFITGDKKIYRTAGFGYEFEIKNGEYRVEG